MASLILLCIHLVYTTNFVIKHKHTSIAFSMLPESKFVVRHKKQGSQDFNTKKINKQIKYTNSGRKYN